MIGTRVLLLGFGILVAALSGCGSKQTFDAQACSFSGSLGYGIRNGDPSCGSGNIALLEQPINGGSYFCSGVLVQPSIILTAAHCVGNGHVTIIVRLPGQQTLRSSAQKIHPGYTPNGASSNGIDIALVLLDQPAASVQPAQLNPTAPPVGETVMDFGYGYDGRVNAQGQSDGNGNFGNLLQGSLQVIGYFNDGIVAQANTGDSQETCEGDSGGPLMYQGQVVGILSGGQGGDLCTQSTNSVYTGIGPALAWLKQNGAA